jgi:hypothetical protein
MRAFQKTAWLAGASLAAAVVIVVAARAQPPAAQAPAGPATPAAAPAIAPAATPAPPMFSPAEQQARQAVLDSPEWKAVRRKFDEWLLVQTTYDPAQVEEMKRLFATRIAAKDAGALTDYIGYMERKLDVLLLPEVAEARQWADELYTQQGKLAMMKEHDMSNPIAMTADQLVAALNRFAADRQEIPGAQAAFQQGLAAQNAANIERGRAAQQAAQAAAARPATSSAYSPARVRNQGTSSRYTPPFRMPYSVGPWGGVWYSR